MVQQLIHLDLSAVSFVVPVVALAFVVGFTAWKALKKGPRAQQAEDVPPRQDPSSYQPLEGNRRAVRRDGVPTLVELGIGKKAYQGWILNRSTTGLCIATRAPVGPGSTIMVRGVQYSEPGPWVMLRVQNCSQDGDDCLILGCQFVGSQPWSVLLHFG